MKKSRSPKGNTSLHISERQSHHIPGQHRGRLPLFSGPPFPPLHSERSESEDLTQSEPARRRYNIRHGNISTTPRSLRPYRQSDIPATEPSAYRRTAPIGRGFTPQSRPKVGHPPDHTAASRYSPAKQIRPPYRTCKTPLDNIRSGPAIFRNPPEIPRKIRTRNQKAGAEYPAPASNDISANYFTSCPRRNTRWISGEV